MFLVLLNFMKKICDFYSYLSFFVMCLSCYFSQAYRNAVPYFMNGVYYTVKLSLFTTFVEGVYMSKFSTLVLFIYPWVAFLFTLFICWWFLSGYLIQCNSFHLFGLCDAVHCDPLHLSACCVLSFCSIVIFFLFRRVSWCKHTSKESYDDFLFD